VRCTRAEPKISTVYVIWYKPSVMTGRVAHSILNLDSRCLVSKTYFRRTNCHSEIEDQALLEREHGRYSPRDFRYS